MNWIIKNIIEYFKPRKVWAYEKFLLSNLQDINISEWTGKVVFTRQNKLTK